MRRQARKSSQAQDPSSDWGYQLFKEIISLVDNSGIDSEDAITSIAYAASRLISENAPDRQTAEDWSHQLSGAVLHMVNVADEEGSARWSRLRAH